MYRCSIRACRIEPLTCNYASTVNLSAPVAPADRGGFCSASSRQDFPEGEHRIDVVLATEDDLAVDNRWHGVVSVEPPLTVPVLTDNPSGLAVTYLSAALESLADAFEVVPTRFDEFDARFLSRYRWVIVDDIGAINPLLADSLDDFVRGGGKLLAFAADRALEQESLPVSGHRLAAASLGSGRENFLAIGQFDGQHPALSGTEGWHRVKVSRSVEIDEQNEDEVLMRLDNGDAFLLEQRRGSGSLLLMLSAVDNRWNDLPVHPVFVGFMIETANYLSGRAADNTAYTAGDSLSLAAADSAGGQVVDPDGNSVLSLADTALAQVIRLDNPGIYEVYTASGQSLIAVNIDPLESELARVSEEVLERWQDATYSNDSPSSRSTIAVGPEPIALWPWLLLMLAVFAIAESALGNVQLTMRTRTSS